MSGIRKIKTVMELEEASKRIPSLLQFTKKTGVSQSFFPLSLLKCFPFIFFFFFLLLLIITVPHMCVVQIILSNND